MREHIFKAKKIGSNEWVQGDLIQDKSQNKYYIASGWIIDQDENKGFTCFDCDNLDEIDPNTICEYTGVNDKNGKMIFEGDIIRNHRFDETLYVRWDEEGLIWKLIPKDSKKDEYKTYELNEINIEAAWGDTPSYEIIGNIYE